MLFCFSRPFEVRQYNADIIMVGDVRNYSSVSGTVPGTDVPLSDFIQTYCEIDDVEYLKDMLNRLDVDYVCFNTAPIIENLEDCGFVHVGNSCGIVDIWRID